MPTTNDDPTLVRALATIRGTVANMNPVSDAVIHELSTRLHREIGRSHR